MLKANKFILLITIGCFSCNEVKTKDNEITFKAPISNEKIDKVVLMKDGIQQVQITEKQKIDSIFSKLKNCQSEFIKFGSKKEMNFYKKDSLFFSVSYSEKRFKYKGVVYIFK